MNISDYVSVLDNVIVINAHDMTLTYDFNTNRMSRSSVRCVSVDSIDRSDCRVSIFISDGNLIIDILKCRYVLEYGLSCSLDNKEIMDMVISIVTVIESNSFIQ